MIYGLYQSAGGMMVQEFRQDVIANNIANAETHGFKRQLAVLAERPAAELPSEDATEDELAGLLSAMSGGAWLGRTYTDLSEGELQRTDEALDVALAGPGFFVVQGADGRSLLTRDGRFVTTPTGQVVSATDGASVLGVGGAPLFVQTRGGRPSVDQDGRIRQDGALVGQLDVVDVANPAALLHSGESRFATDQPLTPSAARVLPGLLERSGVQPVREMVQMIEAGRAYQFNAQMLTLQDQTLGRLISSVAA